MRTKSTSPSGFLSLRAITILFCATAACSILTVPMLAFFRPQEQVNGSQRTLSFEERVSYQKAIEGVYWRHRIWPKERPDSKPSLDAVMSQAQLEKKVKDYLRNSQVLENYWQRAITAVQLQAEMDRMAKNTKQPEVLRELFEALGNDPFIIAECVARPIVAERLLTSLETPDVRSRAGLKHRWIAEVETKVPVAIAEVSSSNYTLPVMASPSGGCTDDTWTSTSLINAPAARVDHATVWTGAEMIVWGGYIASDPSNTGGRYNPSTDSWTATSTTNAPDARFLHTAVWTGSEMIIWGGWAGGNNLFNTGGRYNPGTNSWMATSTTNAPDARFSHTAVWTGSEMIVWGGAFVFPFNTGGRYNPDTNSWTNTSITNAPVARYHHTAVWTGGEMIVWGGTDGGGNYFNTGGRYNPSIDSWTSTTANGAPSARGYHTAVWTDSAMIIWGGYDGTNSFNTGWKYDPGSNSWTATSTANAPAARNSHRAVWTGSEMIVWGGGGTGYFDTGGRYNLSADTWVAASTTNAPAARADPTAVWTGSEMIVWGGFFFDGSFHYFNSGGRYCAQSSPTPTPTPCTGRCEPTPRPRPTPHVRPTPR